MAKLEVDVDSWPRGREVYHYAVAKDLTMEEAIIDLVNSGLSHEEESYV